MNLKDIEINDQKIYLPPELIRKYRNVIISTKYKDIIRDALNKFVTILINNFSDEDLTIFYNNINKLKVSNKIDLYELLFNNSASAIYNSVKNKIYIGENIDDIYHELFHMASSIFVNGISYSGFKQACIIKDNFYLIGKGLNEGYTELLTERYFVSPEKRNAYKYEVHLASRLEVIIGKNKMQSLYLNANLYGLILELKKYASEDEIIYFIKQIDFISKKYIRTLEGELETKLVNALKYINEFLVKVYAKKLRESYYNHLITKDEFKSILYDYILSLGYAICYGNKTIVFFNENLNWELSRILKEITNEYTIEQNLEEKRKIV